jgi:DNA-binding LacI/PurR family transcriptional regulator
VTARDVAQRAGVSQSTVSYVLNDTPNQSLPETTKAKVRQAAKDLGYTPSAAARALRRGSSESVLVVLPDTPIGESVAQALEGITEVLEPHGFVVVYRRQKAGRGLSSLWHELMPAAIANLVNDPLMDAAEIEAAGIPVIGSSLDIDGPEALVIPQEAVGRLHVQHLVERGHRRIAFAASVDPKVREFLTRRLIGVQKECADLGLPEPIVFDVPLALAGAAGAVRELMGRENPPTAVSAYNDEIAFAVLGGMRENGLSAPGDLAVIGVDDIPLAPFAVPPLTSVDIHSDVAGRELGRLVLRRLKPALDLPTPVHETAVDLVQRSTT